ncbi:MAG: MBL fold metallo-hydrolase [bacterium]
MFPASAEGRCLAGLVRREGPPRAVRVAVRSPQEGREISLRWFGHSFFRLISPGGARILTDPFGPEMGLPIPRTRPHAITVSREHSHHNSVEVADGKPLIIRGLKDGGLEWTKVRETVRDVLVYNVPITQRTYEWNTKGAAFVFEMGGLCVAHLGDLAEALNPSQLRRLGKIHLAMVPIGGAFTMGPEEARAQVLALRPNIAIPMHYWDDEDRLARFLRGASRIRRIGRAALRLSRRTLPPPTLFVVMEHG